MSNIIQINDQYLNAQTASFVNGNIFTSTNLASSASYAQTASYVANIPSIDTSSLVTTSSFNSFTSSINTFTASYNTGSFSGSFIGTASWADSASQAITASYITGSVFGSTNPALTASYALTSSYINSLSQSVSISGSVTLNGNLTVFGTASYNYVTASQLDVGTNTISVNVGEPAERFGGLLVYDSGSASHLATASLLWDSQNNHWIYQNASGSTYSGGMLMSGPRNTGSLGDEPSLTKWFIARSDGGDHLNDTQIYSSGSIHIVTGSLTVTQGITGSLQGTATNANKVYINDPGAGIYGILVHPISDPDYLNLHSAAGTYDADNAVFNFNEIKVDILQATGSLLGTASYSNQALTASYAMNGGGTGGTNLGLVYAVSLGYLMP